MKCIKCGKEILDNSSFCSSCGASQNLPSESTSITVVNNTKYRVVSWGLIIFDLLGAIGNLIQHDYMAGFSLFISSIVYIPTIMIKPLENCPWFLVLLIKFVIACAIYRIVY